MVSKTGSNVIEAFNEYFIKNMAGKLTLEKISNILVIIFLNNSEYYNLIISGKETSDNNQKGKLIEELKNTKITIDELNKLILTFHNLDKQKGGKKKASIKKTPKKKSPTKKNK